jgi:hypothetical protein
MPVSSRPALTNYQIYIQSFLNVFYLALADNLRHDLTGVRDLAILLKLIHNNNSISFNHFYIPLFSVQKRHVDLIGINKIKNYTA